MPEHRDRDPAAWRWQQTHETAGMTPADIARFWQHVEKGSSCWNWKRSAGNQYGTFRIAGRTRMAHRVAYELTKGRIPKGRLLRHLCNHKACVNPDHLMPGNDSENARDHLLATRGPDYVAQQELEERRRHEERTAEMAADAEARRQEEEETRQELGRLQHTDPALFRSFVEALSRDCERGSYAARQLRQRMEDWGYL